MSDTMRDIAERVAANTGVTLAQLRGRLPKWSLAPARWRAWARCQDAGFTLNQIGRYFDGRDHTTIREGILRHRSGDGARDIIDVRGGNHGRRPHKQRQREAGVVCTCGAARKPRRPGAEGAASGA